MQIDTGEPNTGHLSKVVSDVKLREVWTDMAEILIRNVSINFKFSFKMIAKIINFCLKC